MKSTIRIRIQPRPLLPVLDDEGAGEMIQSFPLALDTRAHTHDDIADGQEIGRDGWLVTVMVMVVGDFRSRISHLHLRQFPFTCRTPSDLLILGQ